MGTRAGEQADVCVCVVGGCKILEERSVCAVLHLSRSIGCSVSKSRSLPLSEFAQQRATGNRITVVRLSLCAVCQVETQQQQQQHHERFEI